MTGDIHTARVAGPAAPLPRCGDCGERMPTDARFCPSCGAAYGLATARSRTSTYPWGSGSASSTKSPLCWLLHPCISIDPANVGLKELAYGAPAHANSLKLFGDVRRHIKVLVHRSARELDF